MPKQGNISNSEAGIASNHLASIEYMGKFKLYSSRETERLRFLFEDFSVRASEKDKDLRLKHGSTFAISIDMGTVNPRGSRVFYFHLPNGEPVWGNFSTAAKGRDFLKEFVQTAMNPRANQ